MKFKIITIEREYGSGGTEIARLTAEKAGVPCYGKEILEQVSEKLETSIEKIEKYEESVTNSVLYSLFVIGKANSEDRDMMTNEGHIFVAEQAVIKELAMQGKAVFLGHCASEALRGQDGVVRVFVRASSEDKKKRITEEYKIPEASAESTAKRFDKKRANYYYANTAKQ